MQRSKWNYRRPPVWVKTHRTESIECRENARPKRSEWNRSERERVRGKGKRKREQSSNGERHSNGSISRAHTQTYIDCTHTHTNTRKHNERRYVEVSQGNRRFGCLCRCVRVRLCSVLLCMWDSRASVSFTMNLLRRDVGCAYVCVCARVHLCVYLFAFYPNEIVGLPWLFYRLLATFCRCCSLYFAFFVVQELIFDWYCFIQKFSDLLVPSLFESIFAFDFYQKWAEHDESARICSSAIKDIL